MMMPLTFPPLVAQNELSALLVLCDNSKNDGLIFTGDHRKARHFLEMMKRGNFIPGTLHWRWPHDAVQT